MSEIHLSPRETQVLQGIADGETQEYIAHRLNICRKTLILYTNMARRKLGARTTGEAIAKAVALGLINVDLKQIFIVINIERSLVTSG